MIFRKIKDLGASLTAALKLAKETALCSEHEFRHGAVLFRKGEIFNSGSNSYRTVGWTQRQAHRYNRRKVVNHSMHAEIACMHRIPKDVISGSDIFVVRVGIDNEFLLSKPCSYCEKVMRFKKIRRCFYTINNEEIGKIELHE